MAAPSYTSWGDVADAEPSPPATAPASNGPARPDRSSYVPPHLRNRSAGSAPPPSSARPRPKHHHSSSVDGSGLFSAGGSAFALADVPEAKKAMSPEQLAELAPIDPKRAKSSSAGGGIGEDLAGFALRHEAVAGKGIARKIKRADKTRLARRGSMAWRRLASTCLQQSRRGCGRLSAGASFVF